MNSTEIDESIHRKKLLVPAVVILLCAVALTGAAYAYSTSVEIDNNKLSAEYYTIDVYSENAGTYTAISSPMSLGTALKVTTVTVNGTVKVNVDSSNQALGYVGLFLNSSESNGTAPITVTVAATGTGVTASNNTVSITASGVTVSAAFTLGSPDANGYRPINVAVTGLTEATATGSGAHAVASALTNAINGASINLTFTYTSS